MFGIRNPGAESVLCTPKAREAFQRLIDLGLTDSFRAFEQPEKSYSWWDYRMNGFQKESRPSHRSHFDFQGSCQQEPWR